MKRNAQIPEILSDVGDGRSSAFISDQIQMADIIELVTKQLGPSVIWISTFSVSEEFLRRLFFIKKKGNISEINLIIDSKAALALGRIKDFARSVASRIHLSQNHSKVMLIRSVKGRVVTVLSSQNLTRGNRFESYFISSSRATFDHMYDDLMRLVKENSFELYESESRTD